MFHAARAATRDFLSVTPKTRGGLVVRFVELCGGARPFPDDLHPRLARAHAAKETADHGSVEDGLALDGAAFVTDTRDFLFRVRTVLDGEGR